MKKCFIFFTLFIVALITAVYTDTEEDRMSGQEVVMEQQISKPLFHEDGITESR
ncbi:hypothetical protein [Poritiphilus flavus]|uniref:Uncharacterized protein n=1 Tax=Poritiphilus flavus TaxID=2697053 RepID=A0A6L9E7V7_9FLAO|nr:hypothetical protein [Poritiphilus flavus]NAS10827.1 hypothetical protein [Poritiphilus flavus]